jgi:hypothetical protein
MDNRKIASELVKLAKELVSKESVELNDKPSQGEVSKAWPNITKDGKPIFKAYLKASRDAEKKIKQKYGVVLDLQDVYLGHKPNSDRFVVAFDTWIDDDDGFIASEAILWWDDGKFSVGDVELHYESKGVYGDGFYKKLAPLHLRLD